MRLDLLWSIHVHMDLPILSSALENLKRKWYEEVELNPETVLMDRKDFAKRIKPIKELVQTQFEGTEYAERMKRSVEGMNRMSVSEQLTHFLQVLKAGCMLDRIQDNHRDILK